ncbi:hypothetical protein ACFE04_026756 [Oxalis oulophora]
MALGQEYKTYIIHMDKSKTTNFEHVVNSINKLSSQDDNEEEDLVPPKLLYTYQTVMNGFAVALSTKQLDINSSEEYLSTRDGNGHGTHTASTAAGNIVQNAGLFGYAKGAAAGMRYTSRIAAYKVCWEKGCADSDVMAAVDAAVADGVDVLSVSLGGAPKKYDEDTFAIATFGAIEKGVIVSCSAGNSGPDISSVTNTAPWIMTVAASYTDRNFPTTVLLGDGQSFHGSSLYSGEPTKQVSIVDANSVNISSSKYCVSGSLNQKLVEGKIVLCQHGQTARAEKGEVVKEAKGAGMLLLNSKYEGEEIFADPHVLPASALGAKASQAIRKYLNSTENPTAQIIFNGTTYNNLAPVMAAFSSRGPSSVGSDVIKPDITAPGMNILAAWPAVVSPTELSSDTRRVQFNIISGTSMSCPHISGISALIKSVHNDWSPAAIKSALMTTAYTIANDKAPITDIAYSDGSATATPFAFGSGHVNPERAVDPGLVYNITTTDYLNYLCSLGYTKDQISKFSKGLNFTCPTLISLMQPGDLNYPSFAVDLSRITRTSITYKRTVTNVGSNATAVYKVKVNQQPNGVSVLVSPSTLRFTKKGQKLSYNVIFVPLIEEVEEDYSFGSLVWVSGRYVVRSPIAVTWKNV